MMKLLVPALFAVLAAPVAQASVPADLGTAAAISASTGKAYETFARRGRGADDAPGHVRRGRGADHAPETTAPAMIEEARRGRGRGADDAPNHG